MELKRKYGPRGDVVGVEVRHTGANPEQNFSHRLIEQGMADGWVTMVGGTLRMKADPEDLVYDLLREPGYYCKSTGEQIPVSARAWGSLNRGTLASIEARAWLRGKGLDERDYEVTNAYECVLSSEQHAKFTSRKEG